MSPLRAIAAMLDALAAWADAKLTTGWSPKLIAQIITDATRDIAQIARAEDEVAHFPADADQGEQP